jgi:hypothetical protein
MVAQWLNRSRLIGEGYSPLFRHSNIRIEVYFRDTLVKMHVDVCRIFVHLVTLVLEVFLILKK